MTDPIRDAASKQQQIQNTCISSKVQSLGYDRLPKRTGRATIADRVVFFSKNATLVSLVCDNGIFNPLMDFIVRGVNEQANALMHLVK